MNTSLGSSLPHSTPGLSTPQQGNSSLLTPGLAPAAPTPQTPSFAPSSAPSTLRANSQSRTLSPPKSHIGLVGVSDTTTRDTAWMEMDSRLKMIQAENNTLRSQMELLPKELGAKVEGELVNVRLIIQQEVEQRVEAHVGQHRRAFDELRSEVRMVEQGTKEQLAFQWEMHSRDSRKELSDLSIRMEGAQRVIDDSANVKRHVTDIDASLDGLSRRIEQLHTEMMQRYSSEGGVKGKVESLEQALHECRQAQFVGIDELRSDLDKKASAMDLEYWQQRTEQVAGDTKSIRGAQARMERQMLDTATISEGLDSLSERLTASLNEFEGTSLAISAELGEVKGKLENFAGKQASMEVKQGDLAHQLQARAEEMKQVLDHQVAPLVQNKCGQIESRMASKIDSVINESRSWREGNRGEMHRVDEQLGEHETALQRIVEELNTNVGNKLQKLNSDVRELGKRVDNQGTERKDNQNDMRREVSQLLEVTQGLSQQYDVLLSDAAAQNKNFSDIAKDLKTRVETTDGQMQRWQAQLDACLDDVRSQAAGAVEERFGSVLGSIDVLTADSEKCRASLNKLSEHTRTTASAIEQLDQRIMVELNDVANTAESASKEAKVLNQLATETANNSQNEDLRLSRVILDLEQHFQNNNRENKEVLREIEAQILKCKQSIEFLNDTRLPSIDTKLATEANTSRHYHSVINELTELRENMRNVASAPELQQALQELRALSATCKDQKSQVDRVELSSRTQEQRVDDIRAFISDSITELQTQHGELDSAFSTTIAKLDPALKRVDAQVQQAQKSQRTFQTSLERQEASQVDLGQQLMEMETQMGTLQGRVEVLGSKPLASEQALRAAQASFESSNESLQRDVSSMQTHFEETLSRIAEGNSTKTKVIGSAVMELQKSLKALESDLTLTVNQVKTDQESARQLYEQQSEASSQRQDQFLHELKFLKHATQRAEVQANDSKAIAHSLAEMDTKFGSTLEDLKQSTAGMVADVNHVKAKAERTERLVKDQVAKELESFSNSASQDIEVLKEQVTRLKGDGESKTGILEERLDAQGEKIEAALRTLQGTVGQLVQKSEASDTLNSFGIRTVGQLKEQWERFEADMGEATRKSKEEIREHGTKIRSECDQRLDQILSQEKLSHEARELTARFVQELRENLDDVSLRLKKDISTVLDVLGITRSDLEALSDRSPEQRGQFLLRTPVFSVLRSACANGVGGQAPLPAPIGLPHPKGLLGEPGDHMGGGLYGGDTSSVMSSASGQHGKGKPAVGMDCRDDTAGLMVTVVKPGGSADIAGVRVGDILMSTDGQQVPNRNVYKGFIKRRNPGEVVEHVVSREGHMIPLAITLGAARPH